MAVTDVCNPPDIGNVAEIIGACDIDRIKTRVLGTEITVVSENFVFGFAQNYVKFCRIHGAGEIAFSVLRAEPFNVAVKHCRRRNEGFMSVSARKNTRFSVLCSSARANHIEHRSDALRGAFG